MSKASALTEQFILIFYVNRINTIIFVLNRYWIYPSQLEL